MHTQYLHLLFPLILSVVEIQTRLASLTKFLPCRFTPQQILSLWKSNMASEEPVQSDSSQFLFPEFKKQIQELRRFSKRVCFTETLFLSTYFSKIYYSGSSGAEQHLFQDSVIWKRIFIFVF